MSIESSAKAYVDCIRELGYKAGYEAAQPKWISVEDELPPTGERVLACVGRCVVYEGFINCNDKWFRTTGGYEFVGGVTHWMPLPSTEGLE